MALFYCEKCNKLVGITPTDERQHPTKGTSKWWRIDMHASQGEICPWSGRKV